nr:unnamed protein product [Callosobruchus chinensis]
MVRRPAASRASLFQTAATAGDSDQEESHQQNPHLAGGENGVASAVLRNSSGQKSALHAQEVHDRLVRCRSAASQTLRDTVCGTRPFER